MTLQTARRRTALVLACAAGLAACAPSQLGLQAPVARVSELAFKRVGTGELVLLATLDVQNPNGIDLPISNLRFELELMERPFGEGRATQALSTLPARAAVEVPVEITLPTARLAELLRALRQNGDGMLPYRIRGSAGWGSQALTFSFERRGEIDALAALREAIRPLRRP